MVFVLTAGEIDLSIGSIVAVSALLAAVVLRAYGLMAAASRPGSAPGSAIGAINGALVAYVRLPSFLVTLATLGLLRRRRASLTDLQLGAGDQRRLHRLLRLGRAARRAVAGDLDGGGGRRRAFRLSRDAASARMCWRPATTPRAARVVRHQRRRGCASPC